MTFISAKIAQITNPEERLRQRLEHDQACQEVQLHDYQQRPEDGQIILPASSTHHLTLTA